MKKALVILLALVVSGGLFAQSINFNGSVAAGLGLIKYNEVDDMHVGLIARSHDGANGIRTQLDGSYTNADGTMGLNFRLRAIGTGAAASYRDDFQLNRATGWMNFADGLLRLEGGRFGPGSAYAQIDLLSNGDDPARFPYALFAHIRPIDGLSIGVAALGTGGGLLTDGVGELLAQVTPFFGVAYNSSLFNLSAGLYAGKDDVSAMASATIAAVTNIPIGFGIALHNINEFGDAGRVRVHANAGINIIENVGIGIACAFVMNQAMDDPYFRGWVWLAYTMGNIIPRLDVNYVMGGRFNDGNGLGPIETFNAPTWNPDHAFIGVSPNVRFRVTGGAFVDIGYIAGIDMSSNDASAFGGTNGINHAFFIDYRISF